MPRIFILVIGHNSSGKTTVSKKLDKRFDLNYISGDDFRHFLYDHIRFFSDQNNSYPTKKNVVMRPLINDYRVQLTHLLLEANESIVFDGSGFNREIRQKYLDKIKADFPDVKTVIIWTDLPEEQLLERLDERDKHSAARWRDMYFDYRKPTFEPPQPEEADLLLRYDQNNYDEIEQKIAELLKGA